MEINLQKTEANEKEILEMILQFLYENRFIDSAKLLESKANIIYDQNEIQQLKCLLKNHQFDESVKFLESSNFENFQKAEVLKILKSRKFIELVKSNKRKEALEYLRVEIAPILMDFKLLNKYTVVLFDKQDEQVEKHFRQNFNEIYNDDLLSRKVQSLLCLSLDSSGNRILPNSRIETLLNTYQEISDSMYVDDETTDKDNPMRNSSLKTHEYLFSSLRKFQNFTIEKHEDEVWHLELSNDIKHLATCSRNGMIGIFRLNIEVNHLTMKLECISYFLAHKKYLTSIQWSKNNKLLLSSSADKSIKLWEPFEGKCLKTFLLHSDIVSSVKWLNDEVFVSGGIDKKMIICTITNRVQCSELFSRIRKVLVSDALNCLVIIPASMNDIIFFDFKNYREIHRLNELDPIISSNLSLNDEGRYLITNISKVNANINLYDLTNFTLINKYYGHTQEQFCIECSFAGKNDEFIVCGSEDASIYIWHRSNSIPISVIKGHTGSVNNCILSFNLNRPIMFSVSDDFTLRLWTSQNIKITYEDLTAVKSSKKVSDVFKNHKENNFINELSSNLIENQQSQSSDESDRGEENESEISN